jgi:hypothetical protein
MLNVTNLGWALVLGFLAVVFLLGFWAGQAWESAGRF